MLIGSRQVRLFLSWLVVVYSVQYLGVLIDPVLLWNLHICNMIFRVLSRLGSLPPSVLCVCYIVCVLYSALVMPLFNYCDLIWTSSTEKQT